MTLSGTGGTLILTPQKPLYTQGEIVTLDAYPEKGNRFSHWVGVPGTQARLQVQVSSPLSIQGIFVEDSPKKAWIEAQTPGLTNPGLLTPYTGSTRTSQADQVIENFIISKRIYVDHPRVTFRNCRLQSNPTDDLILYSTASGVRTPDGGIDLVLENCDITAKIHILDGFTARRNYVRAAPGGFLDNGFAFAASRVTLGGNLIDNLNGVPGAHLDGIQVMAGSQILIKDNWIEATTHIPITGGGVAGAILLKPDKGPISQVTIQGNRLFQDALDAYYPLRIYNTSGPLVIENNQWNLSRHGEAGPWQIENSPVTTWSGNHWDDGSLITGP